MKSISYSFLATLMIVFLADPVLGMAPCDLFKCDDDLKDCIAKECSLEIGKRREKCITKKCMYAYEDCQKNCKDEEDDENEDKGSFSKPKAYLQSKS